ncbi:hypothetical protein E8101_003934 [Escherichia coli]|nr:hypothetical protein [Escherichia coli]
MLLFPCFSLQSFNGWSYGDDNIFLSNSDSAALYCVAKIFPDGENILIYKVNIINASSKKDVFFMKAQHQPTMT